MLPSLHRRRPTLSGALASCTYRMVQSLGSIILQSLWEISCEALSFSRPFGRVSPALASAIHAITTSGPSKPRRLGCSSGAGISSSRRTIP
jgi:hypothetical protein